MGLIDDIRRDRKAGTPGPWVGGDDPDGEICTGDEVCAWICCVNYDGTTNAQASADAHRISRVPDMEAALLAAEELAGAQESFIAAEISYQATPADRGGANGQKGKAAKAVIAKRKSMIDALSAYRRATEGK